jgi:hypothetical protein
MSVGEPASGCVPTGPGTHPLGVPPAEEKDFAAFLRAACRVIPLAERERARSIDHTVLDRAGRTLTRWQAQPPFDTDGWFNRRLATDGLDIEALRALLAEPEAALADRLADRAEWATWLIDCFRHPTTPLDARPATSS